MVCAHRACEKEHRCPKQGFRHIARMSLQPELTKILRAYRRAGEEIGFWGDRFRQTVLQRGGLATAKRLLRRRTSQPTPGLRVVHDADRADLTVELIVAHWKSVEVEHMLSALPKNSHLTWQKGQRQ